MKSEKDSLKIQHQVLEEQRRSTLACLHHKRNVTSKCFVQWYSFLVMTQREREEDRLHKARMKKIASFKFVKVEDKKDSEVLEGISVETEVIEAPPPAYIEYDYEPSLQVEAKDTKGRVIPKIKKPVPPLPQVLTAMGMYISGIFLFVCVTSSVLITF